MEYHEDPEVTYDSSRPWGAEKAVSRQSPFASRCGAGQDWSVGCAGNEPSFFPSSVKYLEVSQPSWNL